MASKQHTPIVGFCAHSGTGKTTLLKKLIPELKAKGLRLGVIKHAHHDFDTDKPGKDSYELRKAGARQMLVSSSRRNVLITELDTEEKEPSLNELVAQLDDGELDLILVEGFKNENFPKIELFREEVGATPLYKSDTGKSIVAFATDGQPKDDDLPPLLDINNVAAIAQFIIERFIESGNTQKW